jgi:hypothetical protein
VQYSATLTSDEALNFLLDHKCRNGFGVLDWNEAKQIARAGSTWTLTQIPVSGKTSFPARQGRRRRMPGFALDLGDGTFEILDGRHRMSEAKYAGDATVLFYVTKV